MAAAVSREALPVCSDNFNNMLNVAVGHNVNSTNRNEQIGIQTFVGMNYGFLGHALHELHGPIPLVRTL